MNFSLTYHKIILSHNCFQFCKHLSQKTYKNINTHQICCLIQNHMKVSVRGQHTLQNLHLQKHVTQHQQTLHGCYVTFYSSSSKRYGFIWGAPWWRWAVSEYLLYPSLFSASLLLQIFSCLKNNKKICDTSHKDKDCSHLQHIQKYQICTPDNNALYNQKLRSGTVV